MPKYRCASCDLEHDDIPAFHFDRPSDYWAVPEEKRDTDVHLTSDSCVIADRFFFVHGCLEIPIIDHDQVLTFGVWLSLKEDNFLIWQDCYELDHRAHIGPFFGWLCSRLPIYPDTIHLKTMVHLRDHGIRPRVELDQTDHPLAIAHHEGITIATAMDIARRLLEP
jgi:hypothetical protein